MLTKWLKEDFEVTSGRTSSKRQYIPSIRLPKKPWKFYFYWSEAELQKLLGCLVAPRNYSYQYGTWGPSVQVAEVRECLTLGLLSILCPSPSHLLTLRRGDHPTAPLPVPPAQPQPDSPKGQTQWTFHNRIQLWICYRLQPLLREPLPFLFIWSGSDVIKLTVTVC